MLTVCTVPEQLLRRLEFNPEVSRIISLRIIAVYALRLIFRQAEKVVIIITKKFNRYSKHDKKTV